MPHLLRELQRVFSLDLKQAIVSGDEPLRQIILPWRLCLQAFRPS